MTNQAEKFGEWLIFDTAETLADHAAEWLCELACGSAARFSVCLSGGSTPRTLYQRLANGVYSSRFPWNRVHWFWGDERFVPYSDPRSNFRMVWEALLSRVPVPQNCIHAVQTEGVSAEQAAANYETELQHFYGNTQLDTKRPIFDVTFLGVGDNGHTASLFPGSFALQERRRWAVTIVGETKEPRITLTYPTLDSSQNVAFLATGANKTDVLAKIRAGDSNLPAARIRPIGHLWWLVDRTAMPRVA